jgi:O-antigen/teichoic acid export membrane protein
MIGTVLAQAVPVLVLPILTRFIPALELGQYFQWYAASLVCAVLVVCALDMAIYTAETKEEISDITRVVVGLSWIFFVLACILSLVMTLSGFRILNISPLQVLATGVYAGMSAVTQCIIAEYVYDGRFVKQAKAKIIYALTPAALQLLLLVIGSSWGYIIVGQLAGMALTLYILSRVNGSSIISLMFSSDKNILWLGLQKWKRFPMFSLPASLVSSVSSQLPLLAIGVLYGAETAAHYGVALKTIAIPIGLLGGAILTVFKRDASEEFRSAKNCKSSYLKAMRNLIMFSMVMGLVVWLLSDFVFEIGYGKEYRQSSEFAKLLLPALLIGFIASPLSFTFYLAHKQHWDLIWQSCLAASIFIIFMNTNTINQAVGFYSAAYSGLYIIYLLMSWRAAKGGI